MPPALAEAVASYFPKSPAAMRIFRRFLSVQGFNSALTRALPANCRDGRLPWHLRCAAVLMLENQILLSWTGDEPRPSAVEVLTSMGVSAGSIEGLRLRLSRLDRIHRHMCGNETAPAALQDFIYTSRRECKLTLARYLFDPKEVAEQIRSLVRSTPGLSRNSREQREREVEPIEGIPAFEQNIAANLREGNRVCWVAEQTPSEINALVEYPLTTVALAIKPPGSDLEFEVKRAGMRGSHVLDALFEKDGEEVPHYHRLQGASVGFMLEFERSSSDRFATIYRRIHGSAPPMSRVIGSTSISSVPDAGSQTQILNYFSRAESYGAGFDAMTGEMKKCVKAFEDKTPRAELDTPIGWSMRFLSATVPNQAWLAGSSSFRLDRTADLLSPTGAELYFREGLGHSFDFDDARRFADELLEEVLGVVLPPAGAFGTYGDYVHAVLNLPANRAMADETYLRCMDEIGLYWGTLASFGGFSEGESFVPRNVGLKSRWVKDQWRAGICFMDHDCLHTPGSPGNIPAPGRAIDSFRKDEGWICGTDPNFRSEFQCLRAIYRVGAHVEARGMERFRAHVKAAWAAARKALETDPEIQRHFDPKYAETLALRDEVVRLYLESRDDASTRKWQESATAMLEGSLYSAEEVRSFFPVLQRYESLLERYRFLF